MFAVQIIFGFVLSLTIPMSTSATELPYGQLATNGFRNQAQVAYVKPPREFKALKPTTITVPNEVKQVLDELFTRNNTKALMVVRNSQIIYERYSFGVGKRNTPLGFSISKSLTALIVGRAICDGYINSINDPIKKYIPSLSGTSWGESTVKNVLQMSSGAYKKDIKYNGHKNTELMKNIGSALFGGVMNEDFIDLMKLHDDKAFASVIYFNYNNFDTIALGLLVEKSAGLPFSEYFEKTIWQSSGAESRGAWLINRKGQTSTYQGFSATTHDWARVGMMVLEELKKVIHALENFSLMQLQNKSLQL